MSAHDLVVARVRDAIQAIVNEVGETPEDNFNFMSYGSDRRGEQHYVVRRGNEYVRVTVQIVTADYSGAP